MRHTFRVSGGDHGGVVPALEIVVAVGEMDRRVRCVHVAEEVGGVGLITCAWSQPFGQISHSSERARRGFSLKLLPMDVVDAEGLDLEQVGEDRTCGKEQ